MSGPASITILRHGHRVDHFEQGWKKRAARPHDSPLTQEGKDAAVKAGYYAFKTLSEAIAKLSSSSSDAPQIKLEDLVILSSPLIRTIETSHFFAFGFEKAFDEAMNQQTNDINGNKTTTTTVMRIPIHVEAAMIEPSFWLTHDLHLGGWGKDKPFQGVVHHDAKFLNETVSPRVMVKQGTVVKNFTENDNKDEQEEKSDDEKQQQQQQESSSSPSSVKESGSSSSSPLLASPILGDQDSLPESLFPTTHVLDPITGGFADVVPVEKRFAAASQTLLTSTKLRGKHVLLVGHGATTVEMYNALFDKGVLATEKKFTDAPDYTGIALLLKQDGVKYYDLCKPFSTPHTE